MLSYARRLVTFIVWNQPTTIVAGIAALTAIGVIASTAAPALLRRRWKIHLPAMSRLPLALHLFCLSDWILLQILPRLQLSFSKDTSLCLTASLAVRLFLFCGLIAAALPARWLRRRQAKRTQSTAVLFIAVNLAFSAVQVDAYVVEPLLVTTKNLTLASADLDPDAPPVRIVHLTDTHIERLGYREQTVIDKVNALKPDIVVFTGDYINTSYHGDATAHQHFRQFVAQLEVPYGIYATRGTVEPSTDYMAHLIVGVNCNHNAGDAVRLGQAMASVPENTFTLLLFHSPDLIHEAAAHGIDLYLGGHTHGGQLRLPFYGAIATMSKYGKQYEAGLFQESDTTMVISRGIGFEGFGMPRARFLCPPEIVSIELTGKE
jgi:predicted MPP superfamily phosphohydrolase